MASEIELAAEQVLGAGVIPREGMFDPISLPSGLDTRDYLRMSRMALEGAVNRQKSLSSALQDRLNQENTFRQLQASRLEQSALQELDKLDSFSPDFLEQTEMFTELAAYSPAVNRALMAKQSKYEEDNAVLSDVSSKLARAQASDDLIDSTLRTTTDLLKSRGRNDAVLLGLRSRLARSAVEKEQENKRRYNIDQAAASEEIAFTKNLSKFRADTMQKLMDIDGLPDAWKQGDLMSIGYPSTEFEEVDLTADNVDEYVVEPKVRNGVLGGKPVTGMFQKRAPDIKAKTLASGYYDNILSKKQQDKLLELSDRSVDTLVADPVFDDFILPPEDAKDAKDTKKYWKRGSGGAGKELTEPGKRFKLGRESILKDLHANLNIIDDLPLNIQKFFESTTPGRRLVRTELARRKSASSSDAVESVSNIKIEANKYVDDLLNTAKPNTRD